MHQLKTNLATFAWVALGAAIIMIASLTAPIDWLRPQPGSETAGMITIPTATPGGRSTDIPEIYYTVQVGDSCAGIAYFFGITVTDIIVANNLDHVEKRHPYGLF